MTERITLRDVLAAYEDGRRDVKAAVDELRTDNQRQFTDLGNQVANVSDDVAQIKIRVTAIESDRGVDERVEAALAGERQKRHASMRWVLQTTVDVSLRALGLILTFLTVTGALKPG